MIKTFGVSGKMGAGKSTASLMILSRLNSITGQPWKVVSFAGPLKRLVCTTFKMPLGLAYTSTGKSVPLALAVATIKYNDLPYPIAVQSLERINSVLRKESRTCRTLGCLLQTVGQLFRDADPDYWIRAMDLSTTPWECLVVEDVRYQNEAEWVVRRSGLLCRIEGSPSTSDICGRDTKHCSETELDGRVDWHIKVFKSEKTQDLFADLTNEIKRFI